MPTLIADSSCVIDLHKVALLLPLFELPYAIVKPQSLLDDELIRLTDDEKRELIAHGLQTRHLDAVGLVQAERYFDRYPALAWNDCLALATIGCQCSGAWRKAVLILGQVRPAAPNRGRPPFNLKRLRSNSSAPP